MGDEDYTDEHYIACLLAVGYLKGIRESVCTE